jgi:cytochrome c peroxidase
LYETLQSKKDWIGLNFSYNFEKPGPIVPDEKVAVDGAFKVPTIRNVSLTAPYSHK